MKYTVKWEIDIEASNPLTAVREALRIQRDENSIALVFEVEHEATSEVYKTIDLCGECKGCDLDCESCGEHQSDYESLRKHCDWHNAQRG